MTWQLLRLSGDAVAYTSDSANLSIADNLDLRIRLNLDDWTAARDETFIAKRQGGDEYIFRKDSATGRLQFVWWDTGGTPNSETADADTPLTGLGWIRVRRAGTSVLFYTSTTDTDDHASATFTQLGTTQTTPSGSIRTTVATHVTIGAAGLGRNSPLYGIVRTAAILDNTTVRADPRFYLSTEWTVGEDSGDTASDGVNTWTLGGNAEIIGDNIQGVHVSLEAGFGNNPWDASLIWADLTDDLRAADTSRGRSYELDRFDAGTMSTELENFTGKYHSHNTASPYYPNVRPMVPIRLRAVYEGTVYPIWAGFVQRWPVTFPGNIDSIARVESVDLFGPLSLADASQPDRTAVVEGLSPVAWWRFADETDSSVAGTHDLTFNGSPSSGEPGAWTNDLGTLFDGSDDYATVASEADVELLSDMSVEAWFRPELSASVTQTTYNSNDTFTVPANVTAITVEAWGGGGGGAAGGSGVGPGGGGGGGAYARGLIRVTPGTNYSVTVGAAGAAGAGTSGGNGGDTTFGSGLVVADGGRGGDIQEGDAGGQIGGSVGDHRQAGGRGGDGGGAGTLEGGGGGGGGAAGASSWKGQPIAGQSGQASVTNAGGLGGQGGGLGGDGGAGGSSTSTGQAGSAPGGGGGGGGVSVLLGAEDGGAGGAGRVVVSYVTAEQMVPISVRGSTVLYQLIWDGFFVWFSPRNATGGLFLLGECQPDEWHHVLVTVDWSGGSRIIKGYLDGVHTLDVNSSYQPGTETRVVNIGRRATANDMYYKGDISEIVVYNTVLTSQDASALYAAQLEGFATQRTDERVEYVLTTSEVGVGVSIDTGGLQEGQSVISGPNSPTDVSALEAIQIAADTEQGQFFIAADGRPVFHDRYHRLIDQATPVATIDQADYVTLELYGKDERFIYNQIKVFPSDTADPFTVTDEESENEYGRRTFEATIYPDDQNEGYDMAVYLLDLYKQPTDRIAAIHWEILEGVTPIDVVLGAEIGNRYTVTVPLAGDDLEVDVFLERITHTMTGIEPQQRWTVTWEVSPAGEAQAFWLLGVAGFSELGETTRLGF